MFRYDGPSGPGFGMRFHSDPLQDSTYTNFTWLGDPSTAVTVSDSTPFAGQTVNIITTVDNLGDVNMKQIPVTIYMDTLFFRKGRRI